jgi:hypothetical protein
VLVEIWCAHLARELMADRCQWLVVTIVLVRVGAYHVKVDVLTPVMVQMFALPVAMFQRAGLPVVGFPCRLLPVLLIVLERPSLPVGKLWVANLVE